MKTPATIPNWGKYQHYKDRKPPWIKLHVGLLDDMDYWMLPVEARALLPALWLLSSQGEGGKFDADPSTLAFRLRVGVEEVKAALRPLIEAGWVELASSVLAACQQDAPSETETETETENTAAPQQQGFEEDAPKKGIPFGYPQPFEIFWAALRSWFKDANRRMGYKREAFKIWKQQGFLDQQKNAELVRRIKKQQSQYNDSVRSTGRGIGPKDPHRYLRDRRYNDEV